MPSLRKRAPKRSPAADPQDAAAAELAAVALLARRDFACGELGAKLRERGFDAAVVQALIEQLRARRLLNDERYAGHFVQYQSARGQGPVRIGRDLESVGVDAGLIEAALRAVQRLGGAGPRACAAAALGLSRPPSGAKKGARPDFCNTVAFPTIISVLPSGPMSNWIHELRRNRPT